MKTRKKENSVYSVALCGILCAQAVALSWLENLLPALPYMPPGAKPGFSNIVTMFTAGSIGLCQAMSITVIKAGFALLTRGATAGAMSLAGGTFSTVIMWLMFRFAKEKMGLIGISVLSAVAHNIAQLIVASFITGTFSVINYAPFLGLYAIITGSVTGILLKAVMPALEKQKNLFIRK